MLRPKPRGALGDLCRERLDADTKIGHESRHDGDRILSTAPGIHEDLRVRARRQHQGLPARLSYGRHGHRVMQVTGVEQGNDDTCVEDDYRHSRRSLFRAPFG